MELHSCSNCELVDHVISSEMQKFDAVSQENVTLHSALLNARKSIVALESKLLNLQNIVTEERKYNLHVFLQQFPFPWKDSYLAMSLDRKKMNTKVPDSMEKLSSARFSQEKDVQDVPVSTYTALKIFCDKQEKTYEENLRLIQIIYDTHISKLKEQIIMLQNQILGMQEMYTFYRSELCKQKTKNIEEHRNFLETLDTIRNENSRYVKDIRRKISTDNVKVINDQIKEHTSTVYQEIENRDKLVNILRRQQLTLEQQIEDFRKKEAHKQDELKIVISELRKQLKLVKEKYSALEKRRAFDAEGFFTDISQIRKTVAKLNGNHLKDGHVKSECKFVKEQKKLDAKINEINNKLYLCYINDSS